MFRESVFLKLIESDKSSNLYEFYLSLRYGKTVNIELSDVPDIGSSYIRHPSYISNLTVKETGFFATNLTMT
jgi:hypothetical protein